MTVDRASVAPLLAELRRLRDATADLRLDLPLASAAQATRMRDEMVAQLDDYVIPRVSEQDAPLLVVVGGSTGAGKSTLVNTVVGAEVSRAGVLRPTTRSPVLVHHPDDAPWFTSDRILPGLARITGAPPDDAGARVLRLVGSPVVPRGIALLDAPDVDSVDARNRRLAAQLLAAADCWLFITTAARYADAVPWGLLRTARERATALAIVLDRVPPEAGTEVAGHLRSLLDREGLPDAPLLVVPEVPLVDERLPEAAVAPVQQWLGRLAEDASARADMIRRTVAGAIASMQPRGQALADAAEAQRRAAADLWSAVTGSYAQARTGVAAALDDGALLRGEVLARWQEVIGTGELMRTLQTRIGRARDRVSAAVTGRPSVGQSVEVALESNLEALLHDALARGAGGAGGAWALREDGSALLARAGTDLSRSAPDAGARIRTLVGAWQAEVLEIVRAEGGNRRQLARLASYGVNGAGSVLIVALFAQTGGLTGGEVAIAGGTAVVSQKILEAIFGDQAVRSLAARVRDALLTRVEALLQEDSRRFLDLVAAAVPRPTAAAEYRAVLAAVRAP